MEDIILVHPRDGIYNKLYKPWLPLALLSASSMLEHDGFRIRIIDTRLSRTWANDLYTAAKAGPLCVGITSMTGSQISSALEASQIARHSGDAPIFWGGPHPSLFPEQTLKNPLIDGIVQGEGEVTFLRLANALREGKSLDGIEGLWFKENGRIRQNPRRPFLDLDTFPGLPYHLVDVSKHLHRYFSEDAVLEVETSRGCPYACKFCYNALYNFRKFRGFSPERVVDHLMMLNRDFGVNVFHFVDDAFFVNLPRAREIMEGILHKNLSVKMGFQGIRIDTIASMSDDDLDLLYRAGGRFLQFGVESGSPRILDLIDKRLRVDQVHAQNKRLSRYPGLFPLYNFMCGFPSETRDDLLQTVGTAWTILQDNRQAIISPFHHYKHYPGTALYEQARVDHYQTPRSLSEWSRCDWTESIRRQQSRSDIRLMKKVETVSIFADKKIEMQTNSRLFSWLATIYRPVARARLKKNLYSFMPEQWLLNALNWLWRSRM